MAERIDGKGLGAACDCGQTKCVFKLQMCLPFGGFSGLRERVAGWLRPTKNATKKIVVRSGDQNVVEPFPYWMMRCDTVLRDPVSCARIGCIFFLSWVLTMVEWIDNMTKQKISTLSLVVVCVLFVDGVEAMQLIECGDSFRENGGTTVLLRFRSVRGGVFVRDTELRDSSFPWCSFDDGHCVACTVVKGLVTMVRAHGSSITSSRVLQSDGGIVLIACDDVSRKCLVSGFS